MLGGYNHFETNKNFYEKTDIWKSADNYHLTNGFLFKSDKMPNGSENHTKKKYGPLKIKELYDILQDKNLEKLKSQLIGDKSILDTFTTERFNKPEKLYIYDNLKNISIEKLSETDIETAKKEYSPSNPDSKCTAIVYDINENCCYVILSDIAAIPEKVIDIIIKEEIKEEIDSGETKALLEMGLRNFVDRKNPSHGKKKLPDWMTTENEITKNYVTWFINKKDIKNITLTELEQNTKKNSFWWRYWLSSADYDNLPMDGFPKHIVCNPIETETGLNSVSECDLNKPENTYIGNWWIEWLKKYEDLYIKWIEKSMGSDYIVSSDTTSPIKTQKIQNWRLDKKLCDNWKLESDKYIQLNIDQSKNDDLNLLYFRYWLQKQEEKKSDSWKAWLKKQQYPNKKECLASPVPNSCDSSFWYKVYDQESIIKKKQYLIDNQVNNGEWICYAKHDKPSDNNDEKICNTKNIKESCRCTYCNSDNPNYLSPFDEWKLENPKKKEWIIKGLNVVSNTIMVFLKQIRANKFPEGSDEEKRDKERIAHFEDKYSANNILKLIYDRGVQLQELFKTTLELLNNFVGEEWKRITEAVTLGFSQVRTIFSVTGRTLKNIQEPESYIVGKEKVTLLEDTIHKNMNTLFKQNISILDIISYWDKNDKRFEIEFANFKDLKCWPDMATPEGTEGKNATCSDNQKIINPNQSGNDHNEDIKAFLKKLKTYKLKNNNKNFIKNSKYICQPCGLFSVNLQYLSRHRCQ